MGANDTAGANAGASGLSTANAALRISGEPDSQVVSGESYAFTPEADDADGDALTFAVENAPAWASFDSRTGRLSGTPADADVGTYSSITISVSDGEASASLPAFSIAVDAVTNGAATLSWLPPTENTDGTALTDLDGYSLHWGKESGEYSSSVDVAAGVTSYVVENLSEGTWYFATRARNGAGVYSDYSNEASKTVP